MDTRMRMFFWEQWRLMGWVAAAAGFSVMGSVIASVSRAMPANFDENTGLVWRVLGFMMTNISETDAVELADGYAVVSLLLIVFGALLPEVTHLGLDLPTRLLRLPLGSHRLAWGWCVARALYAAGGMLAVLCVRHAFANLPTTLAFAPTLCYYLGGYLLFQGVARLVSAWRADAAVVAVIGLAALLGFVEEVVWKDVVLKSPLPPLIFGAVVGMPLAVFGILLRRRGGLVFELRMPWAASREQSYARVAEIPAFSNPMEAQNWFEHRRYGWHFPVFCLVGSCVALGGAVAAQWSQRGADNRSDWQMGDFEGAFLLVPMFGALLMGLQFAARDFNKINKSRFVQVRPIRGEVFARARAHVVGLGIAQGMIWPILGLLLAVFFVVASEESGLDLATQLANSVFPTLYSGYSGEARAAGGMDLLWGLTRFGLALFALFVVANRYVLQVVLFLAILSFGLHWFGMLRWDPIFLFLFNTPATLFPWALFGLVLVTGLRAGLVAPSRALLMLLSLPALLVVDACFGFYMAGRLLSLALYVPVGIFWALAYLGPLTWAINFDAQRSGGLLPQRRAALRPQWREARGLLLCVAVCAGLVALGVVGWRGLVAKAVRQELSEANALGVGPRSGMVAAPEDAWNFARYDLGPVIAAQQAFGVSHDTARRFVYVGKGLEHLEPNAIVVPRGGGDLTPGEQALLHAVGDRHAQIAEVVLAQLDEARATEQTPTPYSEAIFDTMRNAALHCGMLAVQGAEQRDPTRAMDGLRAATLVLRGLTADTTRSLNFWRADLWQGHAAILGRVLERVALPEDAIQELLRLLPPPTSHEHLIKSLRVGSEAEHRGEDGGTMQRFGIQRGAAEITMTQLAEEVLKVPSAAYAKVLETASATARRHVECSKNKVQYRIIDARSRWDLMRNYDRTYITFTTALHTQVALLHEQTHRRDALTSLCRAALLLELHRVRHGEYPADFAALNAEEQAAFPIDWACVGPQRPIPFRRASPTSVLLYSVWKDQTDDVGTGDDVTIEINRP